MVSESDFPNTKEAYKIFESNEERLLRLELKYLDKVCETEIEEFEKKRAQNDPEAAARHQKRYQEAESTLSQTIENLEESNTDLKISSEVLLPINSSLTNTLNWEKISMEKMSNTNNFCCI